MVSRSWNKKADFIGAVAALFMMLSVVTWGPPANAQATAAAATADSVVSSTYSLYRLNPYQIRTLDPVPLYALERAAASTGAEISPQVLTVLAEGELVLVDDFNHGQAPLFGHWLMVDTWLGPQWIFPLETRYNELREDEYELLLEAGLYDDAGHSLGVVAPQNVHVREKTIGPYYFTSGWYLIDTWLGPKWINGRGIMKPKLNTVKEILPLYLPGSGVLYESPENNQRAFEVTNDPQQVISTEHWRNWYHIKTADGKEGWIANGEGGWNKGQGVLFGEFKPVSGAIKLNAVKPLYRQPLAGAAPVAELGPQTVTVKGQIGHWYQLDTWLGTLWMDDAHTNVLETGLGQALLER